MAQFDSKKLKIHNDEKLYVIYIYSILQMVEDLLQHYAMWKQKENLHWINYTIEQYK